MDSALLAQLNDLDPVVRKQAISAIARSKDPAALPFLATVVRTDPDPDLRELARKAGQYIQQSSKPAPPPGAMPPAAPAAVKPLTPAPPPAAAPKSPPGYYSTLDDPDMGYLTRSYSEYENEDNAALGLTLPISEEPAAPQPVTHKRSKTPVRGESYTVSESAERRAKDIVEAALTANINNDNGRAMRQLYQALMLNPNLINDDYYSRIASGITGRPREEAVDLIINQGERKSFIKSQDKTLKNERKEKHLGEARRNTWTLVGLEMLLYFLINAGGTLAIYFAFTESLVRTDMTTFEGLAPDVAAQMGQFSTVGFLVVLPIVLIASLWSVVALLVQSALIHVIARFLLGGVGTFTNLLAQLLRLYNRTLILIYVLAFVQTIALFLLLGSPMVLCFTLPIVILSLRLLIGMLSAVGKAYDFGLLMGCVSVLGASLLIGAVSALISVLAANALLPVLQSMLPAMPLP